ncbi:hypothetical protein [Streptomyces sp. NPDC090083]|uniref:hypothetical protein n=1 Tax=Streptomyces sp. NPDC090083 TaxID=3365941 RepID=UPI00380CD771
MLQVALLVGGLFVLGFLCGGQAQAADGVTGHRPVTPLAPSPTKPALAAKRIPTAEPGSSAGLVPVARKAPLPKPVPSAKPILAAKSVTSAKSVTAAEEAPSAPSVPVAGHARASVPVLGPVLTPVLASVSDTVERVVRPVTDVVTQTVTEVLTRTPLLPTLPTLPSVPTVPSVPTSPSVPVVPGQPASPAPASPADTAPVPTPVPARSAPQPSDAGQHPDATPAEVTVGVGDPYGPRFVDTGDAPGAVGHAVVRHVPGPSVGGAPARHQAPAGDPDGASRDQSGVDGGASRHCDAQAVTSEYRVAVRIVPGVVARVDAAETRDRYRDVPVFPG